MSGKKGGQGRQKGQGGGKAGGKPHFVPKAVVESHAAGSKPNSGRPRKGANRTEEIVVSQESEAVESTLPRQTRPRTTPALAAIAAARAANSGDKNSSENSSNSTSDTSKQNTSQSDTTTESNTNGTSTPTGAPKTASRSISELRARIAANNSSVSAANSSKSASGTSPMGNAVSNGESVKRGVNTTDIDTSMEVEANEIEVAGNPKKRKAPETREEPSGLKKRAELNDSTPAWKHPINTTDPMKMSLEEICAEIEQVKAAIATLSKAIRAEKFSPVVAP